MRPAAELAGGVFVSEVWVVVIATLAGAVARACLLRVDYRQYPSYPQGWVIHLSMGAVAAFLGALAVPALVAREFAAASFLALAATQFREVRKIEREALLHLEETELVRRGSAYIEGIARVFEARNYLAMLTGSLVAWVLVLSRPGFTGAVAQAGMVTAGLVATIGRSGRGPVVGDVARIRPAAIGFQGPLLEVEGTVLTNVGRQQARELWARDGVAFVIEPKDPAAAATLATPGQRQAILHDLVAQVGVRMDVDEPELAPLARRQVQSGSVVLVLLPVVRDLPTLMAAIARVPLLESSVRLVGRRPGRGLVPGRL